MEEINILDLMLNNWVLYQDKPYRIVGICSLFPDLNTSEFGAGVVKWKDLRPIPLTEDVLLKCGFGMKNDQYFLIIQTGVASNAIYIEFEIVQSLVFGSMWIDKESKNTRKVFLEINYLHELQNLFKCLTKTELRVEL